VCVCVGVLYVRVASSRAQKDKTMIGSVMGNPMTELQGVTCHAYGDHTMLLAT